MKYRLGVNALIIFTSALVVFLVPLILNGSQILAQEFEFPSIPGRIEGTGTNFEIKDSPYLNITLKSEEEIKVALESIPRMISLDISSTTAASTNLTITGLEFNKTYYKYEDSYKNGIKIFSDENGSYSWNQNLTQSRHIWIQEEKSTIYIDQDTTLDSDITGSVEINTNGITLDCNNHKITGANTGYGIYLNRKASNIIKNCTVTNFSYGIYLFGSSNNTFVNNNASNNEDAGIHLRYSNNNTLHNNTITLNHDPGIEFIFSNNNFFIDNILGSNLWAGIYVFRSSDNNFSNNTFINNGYGVTSYPPEGSGIKIYNVYNDAINNKIYHNNFINNRYKPQVVIFGTGSSNFFDNNYPLGGNYWSDYIGIDLYSGSSQDQPGPDGIGDTFYSFTGGQDRYPFMKENGWITNQPPTISNLGQLKSDGVISIAEGEITTEPTAVFKTALNDADNDKIKLQIELRQFGEPFTGIDDGGILNSDFVDSGSEATITREGLVEGQYHWRARAVDDKSNKSDWQEFGEIGNVDFVVKLVPLYTQVRSPYPSWAETEEWLDDKYGPIGVDYDCFDKEFNRSTIRSCGCAITSQVMILRFHGVTTTTDGNDVNPGTFNEWLKDNNGYWKDGGLKFAKIQEYSKDESGFSRVIYDGPISFKDNFSLDLYLDSSKPVILYENVPVYGNHFIVADGKLSTTYTIRDPSWYNTRYLTQITAPYTQNYNNNFYGLRLFSPALALKSVDSISLNLASPAELLIIDSQGRKLGKNPINNTEYNEITGGSYYQEGIGNPFPEIPTPTKESKFIWIPKPLDGKYDVKVIGTDTGDYTLSASIYNQNGQSKDTTQTGSTTINNIQEFELNYSTSTIQQTEIYRIVNIDIKPGSYPNSINLKSKGVTPVAVLTDEFFDAKNIVVDSVLFAGANPDKGKLEDVDSDGDLDLILHFKTQSLQLNPTNTGAVLTGKLNDSTLIKGKDSVRIVGK